jgi:predicted RNA-binding protein YlqC (UPF0109 family)
VTTADEGYVEGDINRVADDELDDEFDDELDDELDDGAPDEGNVARPSRDEAPLSTAVLTHIATSLADEPDQVSVVPEARGRRVTLRLNVAQQDMGRVIGRRGRTAQAIRALVSAAGAKEGLTTSVDIVD